MKIVIKNDSEYSDLISKLNSKLYKHQLIKCNVINVIEEGTLYLVFVNLINNNDAIKKLKGKNILILTENCNDKFLWNLMYFLCPLDIIPINIEIENIIERIESNIMMLESEKK